MATFEEGNHRATLWGGPFPLAHVDFWAHPTDGHSSKSPLTPPGPDELARLAQLSRGLHPEATSTGNRAAPHRSLRRRLSSQAIDELVARYTAGEVVPALSKEYGISASGLRELLRAEGVLLRGHKITSRDAKQAVRLYERGITIDHVAKQVGYSWGMIRRVLHESGVPVRERGGGRG